MLMKTSSYCIEPEGRNHKGLNNLIIDPLGKNEAEKMKPVDVLVECVRES